MATLIPSYEKVLTMKVKPEAGELYLLKFLDKELDSSFEVYFNPFMNGDRPDIVIMRKGYGDRHLVLNRLEFGYNAKKLSNSI